LKPLDCDRDDNTVGENLYFSVFDKVNLFYLRLKKQCVYVFEKKSISISRTIKKKLNNNESEIFPYVRTRGKAEQSETNDKLSLNKKPQITETVFAVFSS
jgi:hypothetical protein